MAGGSHFERMPDGTVVQVPDNITEAGLNRIRAQYPKKDNADPTRANTPDRANTPRSARQQRIDARANEIRGQGTRGLGTQIARDISTMGFGGIPLAAGRVFNRMTGGNLAGGTFFNLNDEAAGLQAGAGKAREAIQQGSFAPMQEAYRTEQRAQDQVKKDFQRDNPGTALAAQALGGMALPFGGGGKTLYQGAKGLRAIGATKAARTTGRAAARMRRAGPIARGVATGAGMGALNAAGNADNLSDVPSALVEGGLAGGAAGGIFGGAFTGLSRGVRAIRDRGSNPETVSARAFERVGSLIKKIKDDKGRPTTGEKLTRDLNARNATGADTRVMDMSAGLRAEAAYLGRQPNLGRSNELQDFAEQRIQDRAGRFGQQVSGRATTKGADVRTLRDEFDAFRSGKGSQDYAEGGAMDVNLEWTDDLNKFFKDAGPTTNAAMRKAYDIMADERRNPVMKLSEDGNNAFFDGVPTFRTLDYLKRGYDDLIERAMGSGNRSEARRISNELKQLKSMMIDSNPEYGEILAAQRDLFQRTQATEIGEMVFTKMKTQPREMLRELKSLPEDMQDEARIGIIDKLLNLDTKADPISAVLNYMRNPTQRKILKYAFGGEKELASFEKYVENEVKAIATDRLVSTSRQSATQALQSAGYNQQEALNELGAASVKGAGFGGTVGLFANAIASLQRAANKPHPDVQDEIIRILMSKGKDLEAGLSQAAKYIAARQNRLIKRSELAARGAATPLGASVGDK